MTTKQTSKAKNKRITHHRLRQLLKNTGDAITQVRKGIVHANWGSGPDRNSFRDKYSVED